MNDLWLGLIYFGMVAVIIFVIYITMNLIKIKKSKKNKTKIDIGEINYLVKKFKLNRNKILYNKMCYIIATSNAFIIAFTCVLISFIKIKFIWQMLIGFVILFALIFIVYEIIGRILVKKGWNKNV